MWNKSMIWKTKAGRFLQAKLSPEEQEEIKSYQMEVDQGGHETKKGFIHHDFIWTLPRA
jgi:hypothetical protein